MGIYQLLFNEKSPAFIPKANRSAYDRKIFKDFQKSLSFIDRIDYLRNGKTCCDKIGKNLGKIRQYMATFIPKKFYWKSVLELGRNQQMMKVKQLS